MPAIQGLKSFIGCCKGVDGEVRGYGTGKTLTQLSYPLPINRVAQYQCSEGYLMQQRTPGLLCYPNPYKPVVSSIILVSIVMT